MPFGHEKLWKKPIFAGLVIENFGNNLFFPGWSFFLEIFWKRVSVQNFGCCVPSAKLRKSGLFREFLFLLILAYTYSGVILFVTLPAIRENSRQLSTIYGKIKFSTIKIFKFNFLVAIFKFQYIKVSLYAAQKAAFYDLFLIMKPYW